jgi:hypothetical protein
MKGGEPTMKQEDIHKLGIQQLKKPSRKQPGMTLHQVLEYFDVLV